MKKYFNLLFVSIAILVLLNEYSCRKKCNCDESYKKIPETTKEWFWFGDGSWWVYRLAEDTTVFDTVTLYMKHDRLSNKGCGSDYAPAEGCSEVLTVFLKHTNARYFPATTIDSVNGGVDFVFAYTPFGGGEFIYLRRPKNEGVVVGFPLKLGENYDEYTLKDTFSNWKLLDKTYNNVIHSVTKVKPPDEYASDVWWAKGIGLLKIIKTAGAKPKTTWELFKFEIK